MKQGNNAERQSWHERQVDKEGKKPESETDSELCGHTGRQDDRQRDTRNARHKKHSMGTHSLAPSQVPSKGRPASKPMVRDISIARLCDNHCATVPQLIPIAAVGSGNCIS